MSPKSRPLLARADSGGWLRLPGRRWGQRLLLGRPPSSPAISRGLSAGGIGLLTELCWSLVLLVFNKEGKIQLGFFSFLGLNCWLVILWSTSCKHYKAETNQKSYHARCLHAGCLT